MVCILVILELVSDVGINIFVWFWVVLVFIIVYVVKEIISIVFYVIKYFLVVIFFVCKVVDCCGKV